MYLQGVVEVLADLPDPLDLQEVSPQVAHLAEVPLVLLAEGHLPGEEQVALLEGLQEGEALAVDQV